MYVCVWVCVCACISRYIPTDVSDRDYSALFDR